MIADKTIAFVGAGFMGEALIRGLITSRAAAAEHIIACDPREGQLAALAGRYGVRVAADNAAGVAGADIVILAVKPQALPASVKELGRRLGRRKLVISIAAGVSVATLESLAPGGARIVRAMPNIAATIGAAVTALCAGSGARDDDIMVARRVFDAVGETAVVEEKLMDAVTGLSGSGPAFVFLFLEALIDAGVRAGLSRETAEQLAGQTLLGAAKMARETGESPTSLRHRVTSPGGTTIAGLFALEEAGFKAAVMRAVEAAARRSAELGS